MRRRRRATLLRMTTLTLLLPLFVPAPYICHFLPSCSPHHHHHHCRCSLRCCSSSLLRRLLPPPPFASVAAARVVFFVDSVSQLHVQLVFSHSPLSLPLLYSSYASPSLFLSLFLSLSLCVCVCVRLFANTACACVWRHTANRITIPGQSDYSEACTPTCWFLRDHGDGGRHDGVR